MDQLRGFTVYERKSYAQIITKILSSEDTQPSMCKRLCEAVAANLTASTRETRSELKSLIWEHFFGRTPQRRLLSRPGLDNDLDGSINKGVASKVFETTELLEAILYQLPVLDLVTASRTNKKFHAVVGTSPSLIPKLFLRPVELTATLDVVYEDEDNLRRRFVIAELNPILRLPHRLTNDLPNRLKFYSPGDSVVFTDRALLAGCWTNMYLTNPPCTRVELHLTYACRAKKPLTTSHDARGPKVRYKTFRRHVRRPQGITFAMLIEAMQLHRGVVVSHDDEPWSKPAYDASARDTETWADGDEGPDMRLDLTHTFIYLHQIALPTQGDVQQMKLVEEAECEEQVDEIFEAADGLKIRKLISRWETRVKNSR